MNTHPIVIVGAGISGAVLAERYAEAGKQVIVIEKRDHIGGNCYDYMNDDGIRISKYGAHIFHTNFDDVWEYVQRFSEWYPYEHRVLSSVDGMLVPIPVNIKTVNMLLGTGIKNEEEMKRWLSTQQVKIENPKNGEEAALARVGLVLYEKLFKYYTKKQWNKYPHELDASVLNRIPVRTSFDARYFTDTYQYLPKEGYAKLFERMLSHPRITVLLHTDYFTVKDQFSRYDKLFYTGPIDRFFEDSERKSEPLEYRSISFVPKTLDTEYYQSNSVINYPSIDPPFTRIVEYKHLTGQKHPKTTIVKEYTTDDGEPYYPVPNPKNHARYEQYRKKTEGLRNVFFVGRLANYKYFNMDEAFKNALDLFFTLEGR